VVVGQESWCGERSFLSLAISALLSTDSAIWIITQLMEYYTCDKVILSISSLPRPAKPNKITLDVTDDGSRIILTIKWYTKGAKRTNMA
jgi:hypothetical protein